MITKYKLRCCFVAIKRKIPAVLRLPRRQENPENPENPNQMNAPMEVNANDIHHIHPLQSNIDAQLTQEAQPTTQPSNHLEDSDVTMVSSKSNESMHMMDISPISRISQDGQESQTLQSDQMEINSESLPSLNPMEISNESSESLPSSLNQTVQVNELAEQATEAGQDPLQQPCGIIESSEVQPAQIHFHALRRIALSSLNTLNIIQSSVISTLLSVYHAYYANESQ